MKQKKLDKSILKKTGEELQSYLNFKRKGSCVEPKKGKGSFKRKPKHRDDYRQCA